MANPQISVFPPVAQLPFVQSSPLGLVLTPPALQMLQQMWAYVSPQVVTSSTLPGSPVPGQRAFVSDSTVGAAGNYGELVAGGGTDFVSVYYDPTALAWRIG